MNTHQHPILTWMLAVCALQLALLSGQAQTSNYVAYRFDTEAEVIDEGVNVWDNWFGTAYSQLWWSGTNAFNDADGNTSSGSLLIEAFFPDAGVGGCCGPQFLAYNLNDGFSPPLTGNGSGAGGFVVTNVELDLRFVAGSVYYTNQVTNAAWPTIEIGTRGVDFGQHNFGTVTVPHDNTNWVHVSLPVGPNEDWVTIPNIYVKHYGPNLNGFLHLHVDNITFNMGEVPIAPPTMVIEKAEPGLRMYAGPSQYTRTQVASVDSNQSWVGGSYPVSYSFTLSDYDTDPSLNELHVFLLPLNHVTSGAGLDQYTDYSTASNNFRLLIQGGENGTPTVFATLAYKTNAINANPNQAVLTITNETATGTWKIQFDSATTGSLTAPGATPAPFSLPADVAATFANPLVAIFGVQPNQDAVLGQHVDFTHIQTLNVAAPGVPIDSDLTTGVINTNIWLTDSVSADGELLVPVDSSDPWWVNWGFPDSGFVLATKADLSDAGVAWKTPAYFTGYDTNIPIIKTTLGTRVETLIPEEALPTTDGSSNGVAGASAYFLLQNPAPAE